MLSRLLGEDIALKNSYAPSLPPIEADLGMLEQVVMNLAVNSRDAMPKGGRLNISTAEIEIGQDYVTKRADARVGRFVCMSVSDTGCGIDAQTIVRIFEPFFTTKEVGKGTGLGLATVYGIVQQHRGWIEVSSEPGQGTTFKIYLPAAQGAALPGADTGFRAAPARGGSETILLVEDETMLREIVADVLTQQGYRVLQAVSAVEALQTWDKQDGKIDFLLTDMIMPEGMGGMDLAIQLRQRKPELKILFMSGYSSEFMGGTLKLEGSGFLAKPFQPSKLVQAIRQVLDSPSPRASTAIPGKTGNARELVPA
jgi:CheY-like chemotaxis protein